MNANGQDGQNGSRAKVLAGVASALCIALLGWNFFTVQTLQVLEGKMEDRLVAMRADFEAQRSSDVNFQTEVRSSLQVSQAESRAAVQRITDILTEVRIRLGAGPDVRRK